MANKRKRAHRSAVVSASSGSKHKHLHAGDSSREISTIIGSATANDPLSSSSPRSSSPTRATYQCASIRNKTTRLTLQRRKQLNARKPRSTGKYSDRSRATESADWTSVSRYRRNVSGHSSSPPLKVARKSVAGNHEYSLKHTSSSSHPSLHHTLASESAPGSSADAAPYDLGASVSKRRRRDRQRSGLCHSVPDVGFSKTADKHRDSTEQNSGYVVADAGLRCLTQSATVHMSSGYGNEDHSKQHASTPHTTFHDLRSRHHTTQCYLLPSSVHSLTKGDVASSYTEDDNLLSDRNTLISDQTRQFSDDNGGTAAHMRHVRPRSSVAIDLNLTSGSVISSLTPTATPFIEPIFSSSHDPVVNSHGSEMGLPYQALQDAGLVSSLLGGDQSPINESGSRFTSSLSSISGHSSASQHGATVGTNMTYQVQEDPHNVNIMSVFDGASLIVSSTASDSSSSGRAQQHSLFNPVNMTGLISSGHVATGRAPKSISSSETSQHSRVSGHSMPPPPVYFAASSTKHTRHSGPTVIEAGRSSTVMYSSRAHIGGRHSPHLSGINHRIAQLQQQSDRSMQLVILQDINQILLMGFEENLVNLNVHGLVSGVLDILDCEEEHLIELKNLACNVLTHMMDVLPRSSDAVVPALPLLLTTMSGSFVGDILERIINLLEQLSRRHGREVLQSGGIASVLGFYDFVTLAQHRTILTMVANCLVNLQTSDFDLLIESLPCLAERLKESDPRCVERVCTCFARLVSAYRSELELLKRIVTGCDLFSNLQHLLMASPPILSTVRDVIHMLAILCSSCPCLAVDLIKQNIAATLYCILTGEAVNSNALFSILLAPIACSSYFNSSPQSNTITNKRHRSPSGNDRKQTAVALKYAVMKADFRSRPESLVLWPPLMLSVSPVLPDSLPIPVTLAVNKRSQEEIHAIVQLICELLPRIPPTYLAWQFSVSSPSVRRQPLTISPCLDQYDFPLNSARSSAFLDQSRGPKSDAVRSAPRRSESEHTTTHTTSQHHRRRNELYLSHRLSVPLNQLMLDDIKVVVSSSSGSCSSSGTLKVADEFNLEDSTEQIDPRARLLQLQCMELHQRLETMNKSHSAQVDSCVAPRRRFSTRHQSPAEQNPATNSPDNLRPIDVTNAVLTPHESGMEALQTVQILLPLLFELFTETTKLQTRLKCLEAIQRMLFYSSPVLLAKTLRPRVVCSHIVGTLNCPERRIALAGLNITLLLIDQLPAIFVTYFRKEGVLHHVSQLRNEISRRESNLSTPGSSLLGPSLDLQLSRRTPGTGRRSAAEVVPTSATNQRAPVSEDCCSPLTPLHTSVCTHADSKDFMTSSPYIDPAFVAPVDAHLEVRHSSRGTNERKSANTSSAPALMPSMNNIDDSANSDDALCYCIHNACRRLDSRVSSFLQSSLASTSSVLSSSTSQILTTDIHTVSPPIKSPSVVTSIDLMPKLVAIASHLGSARPALWVFAFSQLIELLQPSRQSNLIESPSPYELQESGVTTALLHYLTESDAREARLWILYRMFFGHNTRATSRLLPPSNLVHANKKPGANKNWPHLFWLTPVLMDTNQMDQLSEIDHFVDRQLEFESADLHSGPSAFTLLVDCLLTSFHRHEHFQVVGLPSLLTSDCKLLPLLRICLSSDQPGPTLTECSSESSTSLTSTSATHKTTGRDVRAPTSRTRTQRTPSRKSSVTKSIDVEGTCSSSPPETTVRSGVGTIPKSPSHSSDMTTNIPTPGLVWIELVRLSKKDDEFACDNGNGGALNHGGSRSTSGSHSKSSRKSSSSSTSSILSSNSNTSADSPFMVPQRFSLQTTALATVQIMERLLLQRNYVNSLIHDTWWPPDHDYHSLIEACSHLGSREDEVHGFLDPRPFNDDPNEGGLKAFSSRNPMTVRRSHTANRPYRSNKSDINQGVRPTVHTDSSPTTTDSSPSDGDPRLPFVRSLTSFNNGIARTNVPNTVDPDSFVRTHFVGHIPDSPNESGLLQRGLRTLLQRSSEASPVSGPGTGADVNLTRPANCIKGDKPTESWSLRRRSNSKYCSSRHGVELVTQSVCDTPTTDMRCTATRGSHRHISEPISSSFTPTCSVRDTANHTLGINSVMDSDNILLHSSTRTVSSRRRRLKGSSILAAFGALASLSSTTLDSQLETSTKQLSKHTKGSSTNSVTTTTQPSRSSLSKSNESKLASMPSSASTSSSSMSSVSTDGTSFHHGKHRSRLVFYVGGHRLPQNLPLFEAIRKFSPEFNHQVRVMCSLRHQQQLQPNTSDDNQFSKVGSLTGSELEELTGHLMWTMTHVIHYRWVNTVPASDSPTPVINLRKPDPHHPLSSLYRSKVPVSLNPKPANSTNHLFGSSMGGLSSAMTCLKRRRPEEVEHMHLDSPVPELRLNAGTGASAETTRIKSHHPLFIGLTRELPRGFLCETRCACDESDCPSTAGSNQQALSFDSTVDETVTDTLALLRVLHHLSRLCFTFHDTLDPFPIMSPLTFRSPKLSLKASRQLQDAFSILAGNLPNWLTQLISTCPFLFPFEVRRTFFYAYNFDRDRTLQRLQDASSSSLSEIEQLLTVGSRNTATSPSSANPQDGSLVASASPNSSGSTVGSEVSVTTFLSSTLGSAASGNWSLTLPQTDSAHIIPGLSLAFHRPDSQSHNLRGRFHTRLALSPNLRRYKVTVHRDGKRLLRQAEATLAEMSSSRAVLEIAFEGEVGFGLGPTLEFYTLVSRQLMKSSLGMWHGNECTDDGYLIPPASGLYPRPIPKHARSAVVREVRSKFAFLGRLMARALLDWRQLDLPYSPAFFKWFLSTNPMQAISEGHILPNDLVLVDPELGRHVRHLTEMANRRHFLCRQLELAHSTNHSHPSSGSHSRTGLSGLLPARNGSGSRAHCQRETEELRATLVGLDNEIEELCLNFVLPGYEIELVKNGTHISVTGSNLGDYVRLVAHWLVIEGASRQMEAVIEGFDSVLPNVRQRLALVFQPDEMEGLFCGRSSTQSEPIWAENAVRTVANSHVVSTDGWDVASLTEACRCDHGYTLQSRTIRNLFEVMSEFGQEQRRLFLQFVTGSPRLPVGGFRALKPPLKIVMKRESGEKADNHLPSVMTCQNYLKLPDYSSKELLASKLLYAIREGQNAFHLS